ncbi:hypothetical protein ABWV95_09615, partial [Enterococcus faecalis]
NKSLQRKSLATNSVNRKVLVTLASPIPSLLYVFILIKKNKRAKSTFVEISHKRVHYFQLSPRLLLSLRTLNKYADSLSTLWLLNVSASRSFVHNDLKQSAMN